MPLIGELYDQDTVLRHQTNQHNDTDLAEYIHRDTRITHEHQRTGDSQRYGEHHYQRVLETLELGGQHQINHQQGQDHGEHQTGRTLAELFRLAGKSGAEATIQHLRGDTIHLVQTIADRVSFIQSTGNRCRYETVIAIQLGRRHIFRNLNQVIQLDHFPIVTTYIDRF